jgi:ubiquinone/menaquinone biosynthesis C-methylase UbiE
MPAKTKTSPKNNADLVSSERRKSLDTYRLISLIPILPHHWVADVGCGPGYFTVPLGKNLFDGKVFALDVQQEMLDATQKALDDIHLTNVEVMLSKEKELPLDDECLDGALVAFVLQEADNPRALLTEIRRCLKKAGWLAILEWQKRKTDDGPPVSQRIDEERMRAMTEKLGFRISARHSLNGQQYMMLARK